MLERFTCFKAKTLMTRPCGVMALETMSYFLLKPSTA